MAIQPALTAEHYAPRPAWFERLVDCGPAMIKLSFISADGKPPSASAIERALAVIAGCADELAATPHLGAGFAILHRGEEANWLLSLWWTEGGTATRKLWRAELDDHSATFKPVDPLYMACVWELGIIDYERRAWMDTVMSGKTVADYLARTFPRGTV
jgi:hypothetical protein